MIQERYTGIYMICIKVYWNIYDMYKGILEYI